MKIYSKYTMMLFMVMLFCAVFNIVFDVITVLMIGFYFVIVAIVDLTDYLKRKDD